ncbi:MAG: tRNA (N6-threonylcarbamoyladenosine(37)-N6)-methyltransferase TrmO [Syntrophotaleaceae bacterium]
MDITFTPIGTISSCFKEKFGIPRQAGLVPEARGTLELLPPFNRLEALRGLEDFSHIWLVFLFHENIGRQWKSTVRPPRLGGNRRLGVFATRSPFRPNAIGLSAVKLERIEISGSRVILHLGGVDLLDGTPVLDIKPYLPYADSIPNATGGFAPLPPDQNIEVTFTAECLNKLRTLENSGFPRLEKLIVDTLGCDPRPAYYQNHPQKESFGLRMLDFDLRWEFQDDRIVVTDLVKTA